MILKNKTTYYAEWLDDKDVLNHKYLASSIDQAIVEAHTIAKEYDCRPFIIEKRVEKRIILQVKK